MKILKYLLLLFVLICIGFVVFVSTQTSDYSISKSKFIKTPNNTAFKYVSDYSNWQYFVSWNENDALQFVNIKSESSSWNGEKKGNIKTTYTNEIDSLSQKINFNTVESELFWKFEKVKNGTQVTVTNKGKMDLMQKLKSYFNQNSSTDLADELEKSLINLDKNLNYEINNYAITQNGIENFKETYFIGKTINSNSSKNQQNIYVLIKQMTDFFDKNDMNASGKPFVIYNSYGLSRTNLSVCMPIKDSVFIAPNSDVFSGKIPATKVIKVNLTGDFSHINVARDSANAYLLRNNFEQSKVVKPFIVYQKTKLDTKKSSQFLSQYILPIYTKPEVKTASKPSVLPEEVVNEP